MRRKEPTPLEDNAGQDAGDGPGTNLVTSKPAMTQRLRPRRNRTGLLAFVGLTAAILACTRLSSLFRPSKLVEPWVGEGLAPPSQPLFTSTALPAITLLAPSPVPGVTYGTPTPDPTRQPPVLRELAEVYVVQRGDTLARIAARFGVTVEQVMVANSILNPDLLAVGQVLTIPPQIPLPPGPSFKIIPDSELVYGPASALLDLPGFVASWDSALSTYQEEVEDRLLYGGDIVQLVAESYSVNPRLLLALLEFQSGFVRQRNLADVQRAYPVGWVTPGYEGLFSQLSWAADQFNAGYYRWLAGWNGPFLLSDGNVAPPGPGINAGTAGVQYLLAQLLPADAWRSATSEGGLYQTYVTLFGSPFELRVEPLLPPDLAQPGLQLPFEPGKVWSFTGGPHAGWGNWGAWAAIDFAPPGEPLGCVVSNEWVVAMADGLITRADQGQVIQDLDGDGLEQTGWVLFYLHLESRERVQPGSFVRAGDRIGHPSCEGGVSSGTHVHLARKYNGVWIDADGPLPFEMEGWVTASSGSVYDGSLSRGGVVLEACSCRNASNQISR